MTKTIGQVSTYGKQTESSFDIISIYSYFVIIYISILGDRANVVLSTIALIALVPLIKSPKYLIGPMFFVTIFDEYLVAFSGHSFSRYICIYFIISVLLIAIRSKNYTKINIHSLAVLFMILMGGMLSMQGLYEYTAFPAAYIFALLQLFFLMKCHYSLSSSELVNMLYFFSIGAILFSVVLMMDNNLSVLTEIKRVSIGETNANQTAFGLAVVYIIIFSHFLLSDYNQKLIHSILLLIGIVCVLLTGSRTALIACVFSSLVIFYCGFRKGTRKFTKTFIVFLSSSLALIAVYEYLYIRFPAFMSRFTADSILISGGTGRLYIWEAYFKYYFPSYWIFGIGFDPRNFYYAIERVLFIGHGAHNIVVDILASTGVLGLFVYGMCIIRWLFEMYKGLEKNRYLIVPFGMVICILLLGIGENIIRAKMLWLSFGFGFIMLNRLKAGINND